MLASNQAHLEEQGAHSAPCSSRCAWLEALCFALFFLSFFIYFPTQSSYAQTIERKNFVSDTFNPQIKIIIVGSTKIEGNRRTRRRIVQREIEIEPGDTLRVNQIRSTCKHIGEKLYNAGLFNKAEIDIVLPALQLNDSTLLADFLVTLEERWYLYPYPILELADRNFNEWFYNQGANISRINYGTRIEQYNLTGNNDPLKVGFQTGFLRRYEIYYRLPYLDKRQKGGITFAANYNTVRNLNIFTENNIQTFKSNGLEVARARTNVSLGYTRREGFYQFYEAGLAWNNNTISDTMLRLNPDFFGNNSNSQKFFQARFSFRYDKRNYRYYATEGYFFQTELEQNGLLASDDLSLGFLRLRYGLHIPLNARKSWLFATGFDALTSYPQRQPYNNTVGVGYLRRIIRGYDRYLIEGPHSFIVKNTLRYKLFERTFYNRRFNIPQLRTIPISIYPKLYFDGGFVQNNFVENSNARLSNKVLGGAGIGLDIVTFYDFVLRTEYSVNQFRERGLYIYIAAEI